MVNSISPQLFFTFVSTFKFYNPVSCLYSEVSPVVFIVFYLSLWPRWNIGVYSRYYNCRQSQEVKEDYAKQDIWSHCRLVVIKRSKDLHFFFFVNAPPMCLLFNFTTICLAWHSQYVSPFIDLNIYVFIFTAIKEFFNLRYKS